MNTVRQVRYAADQDPTILQVMDAALEEAQASFERIKALDQRLERPIIDRDLMAMAVVLKPGNTQVGPEAIWSIGSIGEIPSQRLTELFTLKAISRAFDQRERGALTDVESMHRMRWLPDDQLYRGSAASVDGVHVGFAGGWAHHGRWLAATIGQSISEQLRLPPKDQASRYPLEDLPFALGRLAWLNAGQDSGDNTPVHALEREQYTWALDMLSTEPAR